MLLHIPLPPPRTTLDKHPTELDSQAADSVPEQKLLPLHTPTPTETLWQCWVFCLGGWELKN